MLLNRSTHSNIFYAPTHELSLQMYRSNCREQFSSSVAFRQKSPRTSRKSLSHEERIVVLADNQNLGGWGDFLDERGRLKSV